MLAEQFSQPDKIEIVRIHLEGAAISRAFCFALYLTS
jgi:hypothetical protein